MKYWDTSAMLRAWKEDWRPGAGITRTHTISEWYHIQTGRGLLFTAPDGSREKRALTPATAAREARALFKSLTFVELEAGQVFDALDALAKIPGLKASAVHDFLHIRAAELNHATAAVTLNQEEWGKMTGLRLELPRKA
jgi:hypothetical protein